MGEPQSRKRKFKGGKANDNKVKDVERTAVSISESDVSQNTKKSKKNKSLEKPADTDIVNKNENDDGAKPKKAKKKHIVQSPNGDTISKKENPEKPEVNITETSNVDVISVKATKRKIKKARQKANKLQQSGDTDEVVSKKAKMSDPEESDLSEEMVAKYPVLKDEDLVKRFMAVGMTNNQKGRVRQALRDILKGTSETMLPEVIHTKMQAILKTPEPIDSDMRKLRILYNMLKSAARGKKYVKKEVKKIKEVKKKDDAEEKENGTEEKKDGRDKKPEQKVKGPKRYVVFIGNLPLDITEDKILEHFSDLSGQIVNVRIPKPLDSKKSAIAYLEVKNEVSYELALSKHHSMLDNRRVNVLYSTQQTSKISKAEAKGKAAKLVAMQKSGQLAGSAPLSKKRSARRKKMKLAQKKAQEAMEKGAGA